MDGTAVVSARSIALRRGTVLQWEFGATPSISTDFAPLDQIDGTIVDTSVTVAVLLGSSTKSVLRTAPVLRVGITLSSAKEGTALSIGAVVASAGKSLDRCRRRCRSWNWARCRSTCFGCGRGRITIPATMPVCLAACWERGNMVALGSTPVRTASSILPCLPGHKDSQEGPAGPKHVAQGWQRPRSTGGLV